MEYSNSTDLDFHGYTTDYPFQQPIRCFNQTHEAHTSKKSNSTSWKKLEQIYFIWQQVLEQWITQCSNFGEKVGWNVSFINSKEWSSNVNGQKDNGIFYVILAVVFENIWWFGISDKLIEVDQLIHFLPVLVHCAHKVHKLVIEGIIFEAINMTDLEVIQ